MMRTPDGRTGRTQRAVAIVGLAAVAVVLVFFGARFVAGLVAGGDGWDVVPGQPVEVTIESGSSANTIYRVLNDASVVRARDLETVARAAGVEDRLKAGTYAFTTDMEADAVVRRLVAGGDVVTGSSFTLIEGWTVDRIIDELARSTPYSQAEFQKALRDGAVRSPWRPAEEEGVDGLAPWEGLLFPATYRILDESTPAQILQMMADEMTRRMDTIEWSRIGELDISRYDVLIIGSMIEREAKTDPDRPIISSVIHNRLGEGMRLQIDATVIYALGYNPGRVLDSHLAAESPYNTYRIRGLPPTPIGAVSTASLNAAANPAETEYLFYVLGHKDGTHFFAVTYEEHQVNIEIARAAGILP